MNKPIDTLLIECISRVVCLVFGHAWLSTGHNQRKCNRCPHMEIKSPQTSYKWVKYIPETKDFNPCK